MTVEQYKTNNLLKTEVTSHDVAELAAEMCGPLFAGRPGRRSPLTAAATAWSDVVNGSLVSGKFRG